MKIQKYILILAVSLSFWGCDSDFLTEVHPVQSTGGSFFATDAEAEQAALGLYEYTRNLYYGRHMVEHFASNFDELTGDNVTLPKVNYNNAIVPYLTLNYNEESGSVQNAWSTSYTTIYRANWLIDNVTDNENISDEVKKETLAQAYFFRGFCYFNLTRLFEEVPLMLKQTTAADYYPEKSTNEECWSQVFSDFQKALDLGGLPAPTENFVDGKINTGVVNAIMARAYLYRTRPGSTEYWDKVKQHTEAVENLNTYALEPIDDFSKFFNYTSEDTWVENKEMIWVHGYSYAMTYGGLPFLYDGNNYAAFAYMSMPVGTSTTIVTNDKGSQFLIGNGRAGRAYWAASTSLSDVMIDYYQKGDKRTSEFLLYPAYNDYGLDDGGSIYLKKTVNADSLYKKFIETDGVEGEYLHFKKFQIREFVGENIWDGGFNHSMVFPIIRYSDILLMRAEAEYHLGSEGLARDYLKQVTDRAGFAADYLDSFSGDALLDEILQQRRVELMNESLRTPDLKRLDMFKPPYVGTYPGSVSWDEKLGVLPIPNRELDANPNMVQHDLWR